MSPRSDGRHRFDRRLRLAYDFKQISGGGALKVLFWQAPTLLNPHFAVGGKDQEGSRIFYEPLAAWDPDGNLVPVLAAEIPEIENRGVAPDAGFGRLVPGWRRRLREAGMGQKVACKRCGETKANHPAHEGAAGHSACSHRRDHVSQLLLVHRILPTRRRRLWVFPVGVGCRYDARANVSTARKPEPFRTFAFRGEGGKVWNRRNLPVPARSGGGRLTERTPAVQPRWRERVKVPHFRPIRDQTRLDVEFSHLG